ncbi:hypothetical protein Golomagni_07244, partial [Golovinomyces magnicellulatus]
MKSIVQAVLSAMSGIGAAMGFALHPAAHNPYLVYMYSAMAGATFCVAVVFWAIFHNYNAMDAGLNERSSQTAAAVQRFGQDRENM